MTAQTHSTPRRLLCRNCPPFPKITYNGHSLAPEPQLLCQLRPQLLQQCVQPLNVDTRGQLTHQQAPVKQGVKVGSRGRLLVTLLRSPALAVVLGCVLLLVGVGVGMVVCGGRG